MGYEQDAQDSVSDMFAGPGAAAQELPDGLCGPGGLISHDPVESDSSKNSGLGGLLSPFQDMF